MRLMKNFYLSAPALCFMSLTIGLASSASAQTTSRQLRAKIKADKPSYEVLKTPKLQHDSKTKSWDQKNWLEAAVKFKVEKLSPMPKDKTLPSIKVKWYVAVKNPNSRGYLLMEKEIEHVNIPVGEDVYTSVYISPTGGRRITNGRRISKKLVYQIGGEFFINGSTEPIYTFSSLQNKAWWKTTSRGLAKSKSIKLRSKDQTPFRYLWYDNYATIATQEKEVAQASSTTTAE